MTFFRQKSFLLSPFGLKKSIYTLIFVSARGLQSGFGGEVLKMGLTATDNITNLLQTFLDVQSQRAQVVAGNIANADTPGYVAKELKFDDFLREAARQSELPESRRDELNPVLSKPQIVDQKPTAIGFDGNTVDAGREMADLAQTGTNFNFGAKMLQSRLRLLRMAIREGK